MEIKICNNCGGSGKLINEDIFSENVQVVDCKRCEGSGRILHREFVLEVPYGQENARQNFINKSDKILKIIRELNTKT